MELRKSVALFAGTVVILAACNAATSSGSAAPAGGAGLDGALVKRSDIKIEIVTHGQAQDGFWGVVRNGVKAGAADMGVTVTYNAPAQESDMPGMSALIDAAALPAGRLPGRAPLARFAKRSAMSATSSAAICALPARLSSRPPPRQ